MHSSQTFGGLARLAWRGILLHETTHPRECVLLFLATLMNWVSQEARQKKASKAQMTRLGVFPGFLQPQVCSGPQSRPAYLLALVCCEIQ